VQPASVRCGQGLSCIFEWVWLDRQLTAFNMDALPEHNTGDEKHYNFRPFCGKTLRFAVQAAHDAHLCFTCCEEAADPMLEVFIGAWEGEYSAVRFNQGDDLVKQHTPDILSADEFKEFWITFSHQEVLIGKGGEHEAFMIAAIPEDLCNSFFGYSSGYGATAAFKFFHECEVATEDKLEYEVWQPMYGHTVTFSVTCAHDAHLMFSPNEEAGDPCYEVFLGGWENQHSAIRKNAEVTTVKVETPDECGGEKTYTVDFFGGHIKVFRQGESDPFMDWEDPEAFVPKYFSVVTGWGATGTWKLEV